MSDPTSLLGYNFKDSALKNAALRHSSLQTQAKNKNISIKKEHFERLEFLGDRVVGLVIAEKLLQMFPNESEGSLSRYHTALVKAPTMARLARLIKLDIHLNTALQDDQGRGGGVLNETILADALEAYLGAIYLDSDFKTAQTIIKKLWESEIKAITSTDLRDPKTRLQEWSQAHGAGLPTYRVLRQDGPAHAPHFDVEVTLPNAVKPYSAQGSGPNKKIAEQNAALAFMEKHTNE